MDVSATAKTGSNDNNLFAAAKKGDMDEIKRILADPFNLLCDGNGQTLLHRAVQGGKPDLVNELINQQGADPNIQDIYGRTALHLACQRGCQEAPSIVDILLQHPKINVNARTQKPPSRRHRKKRTSLDPLDHLWKPQKQPSSLLHGNERTPLAYSLNSGVEWAEITRKLIRHGAAVKNIDNKGGTALHYAVKQVPSETEIDESLSLIDTILSQGRIDINQTDSNGSTALHYSIGNLPRTDNEMEVIQHLVEKGADINQVDGKGKAPLHMLCKQLHDDETVLGALECLLQNGATTDVRDQNGATALHVLCQGYWDEVPSKAIDLLLQYSGSFDILNSIDDSGLTPLHVATNEDALFDELVKNLLQREGINVNTTEENGRLPLHLFCENVESRTLDTLKILVSKTTNLNVQDKRGDTALHVACWDQKWNLVQCLLEQDGIELQTLNQEGLTPLMVAASVNSPVEFLFEFLVHTGGTVLAAKQMESKKRSYSSAFEQSNAEDEERGVVDTR